MKWSIRDLLNPVATRSLLFGTNPFDLEYVLKKIDAIKVKSGKQIQAVWLGEWGKKIERYNELAAKAEEKQNMISARAYYKLAMLCHYACFMINTDDIEKKQEIYSALEKSYRKYTTVCPNKVEFLEIDTEYGKMPAYLHYPDDGSKGKYALVVTYSGIGSCKEELEMLAEPMNERGAAVLCVDMPGAGASIIWNDMKCGGPQIEAAYEAIARWIDERADIDSDNVADFGLCMGGGYAFRAAVKRPKTKCCVTLFPLLMGFADMDSIPTWMKRGKFASSQYGEDFLNSMNVLLEGTLDADYLLVYSPDDNWMDTDASMKLYNRAVGYKEKVFVDEKPAYVSEETIMHAMPVGEQFHWVKHIAADFIAERILK